MRLREAAGLTMRDAARLIYCTTRAWEDWETGRRRMHPAFFLLFRIRIDSKGLLQPLEP